MLLWFALAAPDTAQLEQLVHNLYHGVDEMELRIDVAEEPFVAFIADEEGKPVTLRGAAGVARLRAMFAAWKAEAYTAATQLSDLRCQAHKRVGLCTVHISQDLFQAGEKVDTLSLRATVGGGWDHGRWRLTHLHESASTP